MHRTPENTNLPRKMQKSDTARLCPFDLAFLRVFPRRTQNLHGKNKAAQKSEFSPISKTQKRGGQMRIGSLVPFSLILPDGGLWTSFFAKKKNSVKLWAYSVGCFAGWSEGLVLSLGSLRQTANPPVVEGPKPGYGVMEKTSAVQQTCVACLSIVGKRSRKFFVGGGHGEAAHEILVGDCWGVHSAAVRRQGWVGRLVRAEPPPPKRQGFWV